MWQLNRFLFTTIFIRATLNAIPLSDLSTSTPDFQHINSNVTNEVLDIKFHTNSDVHSNVVGFDPEKSPLAHEEHNQCPWVPVGFMYSPGLDRLHAEIEQFFEYMQPTPTERALRESVLARLESVILELWPNACIELFGSGSTRLALPNSDIDIKVHGVTDPSHLRSLKAKLEASNIAISNSVTIIENATVPIIEFVDRESKIDIDVRFGNDSFVKLEDLMNESKYAAHVKLMFVLKHFLKERGLNKAPTGGIASFALSLLCINFMQMNPNAKANEDFNLGELLLGFLELYGRKFDYETTGISVLDGGKRLPRNELSCGISKWNIDGNTPLFCIQDPYEPRRNAGRAAYRGSDVKQAFDDAYTILSLAMSSVKNDTNDCSGSSILSHIVHASEHFINYRIWIRDTFENKLASPEKVGMNCSSSNTSDKLEGRKNSSFDVLVFAQRWSITECIIWMNDGDDNVCTLPSKEEQTWTIHGIWPTKIGTDGPSFCNSSDAFDINILNPLLDRLHQHWTNVHKGTSDISFWEYEWFKHGSCANTIESMSGEKKYFSQALAWHQQFSMAELLSKANIRSGTQHGIDEFHNAVKSSLNVNPVIQCFKENDHNDVQYLSEIRICFNKQLELVDCSLSSNSSSSSYSKTDNIITNCNKSQPIFYPSVLTQNNIDRSKHRTVGIV